MGQKTKLFSDGHDGLKVYLSAKEPPPSRGIPVLVVEERDGASFAFAAAEEIAPGLPAVALAEAFLSPEPPPDGTLRRARRTRAALEAARRFAETAPLVRRTPGPGYVPVPFLGTVG
jgi:hypothetical protein